MIGAGIQAAMAELVARTSKSVLTVGDHRGGGAGVMLAGGIVVTNDHVARGSQMAVSLQDGPKVTATVIARDADNDLAALYAPGTRARPVDLADSSKLKVGQLVFALGHPLGWSYYPTAGIVSASPVEPGYARGERGLLRLDVSLAPGNSGGPIVDSEGRLIGVACMITGPGISLAVPSAVVKEFANWARSRAPVAA
jgi:serine protease Do